VCRVRARSAPGKRSHSCRIHTPSRDPAARSLASVLASRRSVFARAWRMPVSEGLTTRTCATCGSISRAISHAFPETSSATRSSGARLEANNLICSGFVSIRPAERSHHPRRSRPRRNPDAHPTRLTSSLSPSAQLTGRETPWAKRHQRIRARSATGQVAGAATEKAGLNTPIVQRSAYPSCVLPESPCPGRRTLPAGIRTTALESHFHAPTRGCGVAPSVASRFGVQWEQVAVPARGPTLANLTVAQ
jgi:hypothetical protein